MCTARTAQDGNKFLCALTMKRKKQQFNTKAADDSDGRKKTTLNVIYQLLRKGENMKECLNKTLT